MITGEFWDEMRDFPLQVDRFGLSRHLAAFIHGGVYPNDP